MKSRILYIGSFEGSGDEGLSQLSNLFRDHFSSEYDVIAANTFDVLRPKSIVGILRFNPHIIHYITGPTIRSIFILKVLKILLLGRVKTIASATRPFFMEREKKWLKFFKPDLVLTQAGKWQKVFEENNIKAEFLPNPIDTRKFKKLSVDKSELRKKYDLPLDKKLLLHVGHIRPNRNVEFLAQLQSDLVSGDYQVIVVSSSHFQVDSDLLNNLKSAGCIIIKRYIENIAELYNACDYYVFPVKGLEKNNYPKNYNDVGVIDMPLSILEAIACGLPVITTKIDAIEVLIFGEHNIPIAFIDDLQSVRNSFIELDKKITATSTNSVIDKYKLENIFNKINNHYITLLD